MKTSNGTKAAYIGGIAAIIAAIITVTNFKGCFKEENRSSTISGIVKEEGAEGRGIPNAELFVIGSSELTTSESNGRFSITIPETETEIQVLVRIQHKDYNTVDQSMRIGSQNIPVVMKMKVTQSPSKPIDHENAFYPQSDPNGNPIATSENNNPSSTKENQSGATPTISHISFSGDNKQAGQSGATPTDIISSQNTIGTKARYALKPNHGTMIKYYLTADNDNEQAGQISDKTDLKTVEISQESYIDRIKFEFFDPSKQRYIKRWIKKEDVILLKN